MKAKLKRLQTLLALVEVKQIKLAKKCWAIPSGFSRRLGKGWR
jgi:hypothetical protein